MDSKRTKIMLVDDNIANLAMGKNMLKEAYEVYPVPSAAKLFQLLEHVSPGLILLDVMMPEMDGYEAIKKLKADDRFADIPVIFLTSMNDESSELEGLSLGAIDYVIKPFSAPLLLKRIENHLLMVSQRAKLKDYNDNLQIMVEQKTSEVFDLQNAVLSTLAEMVEFRDNMTGGHVTRTKMYLEVLLNKMVEEKLYHDEVRDWNLDFLLQSAQLHDVGKIAISDAILNKPGRLEPHEFEEMKKHVLFGVEAINKIAAKTSEHSYLHHAAIFAGTHHEKWDGSGYPNGLAGYDIPLEGRLMAIADVFDALISERPYKPPMPLDKAINIIVEGAGTHFDEALVKIFLKVTDKFGEISRLGNDEPLPLLQAAS
ncbi:MAG: response regulator [Deltaproteobacteria bacterium]|jgi:putative two-component system response regulator|nr:response regulator [Deltaproteobacteria bacterium]